LAQPAKPEIGRKPDDPDHKDTGKDALGAKGLLRLQYHVAHTDSCPDHLGGDDHDQGNSPGQTNSREDVRQAGGQHDALKISNSLAPRERDARIKKRVETNIGQALRERRYQVQLALVAVVSLIDEKLQQLISSPPNSDEARRGWINEKSELEKLRGIVKRLQTDVADYLAGAKPEKEPVRSVKSFAEAVEDYWTKNQ
jgi:hypothetical protein